jgi:hypothetical protein
MQDLGVTQLYQKQSSYLSRRSRSTSRLPFVHGDLAPETLLMRSLPMTVRADQVTLGNLRKYSRFGRGLQRQGGNRRYLLPDVSVIEIHHVRRIVDAAV